MFQSDNQDTKGEEKQQKANETQIEQSSTAGNVRSKWNGHFPCSLILVGLQGFSDGLETRIC
jgi:hypothetical protein